MSWCKTFKITGVHFSCFRSVADIGMQTRDLSSEDVGCQSVETFDEEVCLG